MSKTAATPAGRTTLNALRAQADLPATASELAPHPKFVAKLNSLDGDFLALLGSMSEVARFKRIVLNAVALNADLLQTEPRSLLAACMRAAQDRLMPDGREAVLNIYRVKVRDDDGFEHYEKRAQYLPMVAGIVKRLFASGAITYLDAACVYEKDGFEFVRGDESRLEHRPHIGTAERGPIVAAYCVLRLKSGELKREVMTLADIERVRASSKQPDKGPWLEWFDQQAIKSVIKRIAKQIDVSREVAQVLAHDNDAAGLAVDSFGDYPPPSSPALAAPEPPATPPPNAAPGDAPTQTELYAMARAQIEAATTPDDLAVAQSLIASLTDPALRRGLEQQASACRLGMQANGGGHE